MTDMWKGVRTLNDSFGAYLKRSRQNAGLTLVQLVKDLDYKIDVPMLSRIENGGVIPNPEQGKLLSEWCLQHAESDDEPVARHSDPDTSHAAAKSVNADTISKLHRWWLEHLRWMDSLDMDQLQLDGTPRTYYATDEGAWDFCTESPTSQSGFRTRRSELVRAGFVKDSGQREQLRTGRNGVVWQITDEGKDALNE